MTAAAKHTTEPASPLAPRPSPLDQLLHDALRHWNGVTRPNGLLTDLLVYRQALHADAATPRQATNQVLTRALAILEQRAPEAAALLRLRFTAKTTVDTVGERLGFAGSTVFAKQADALHHLAAVVGELEAQAWQEQQLRIAARIDGTPHAGLLGIDGLLERLEEVVTRPARPGSSPSRGSAGSGRRRSRISCCAGRRGRCTLGISRG